MICESACHLLARTSQSGFGAAHHYVRTSLGDGAVTLGFMSNGRDFDSGHHRACEDVHSESCSDRWLGEGSQKTADTDVDYEHSIWLYYYMLCTHPVLLPLSVKSV